MLNYLKCVAPLLLCLFTSSVVAAQNRDFSILATIGIATPVLDNGIGVQIGVNPCYALGTHFALEGQLSYLHSKINGSFLSGEKDISNTVNLLVGGRLYLTSEERKTRYYLNLLLGHHYNHSMRFGRERDLGGTLGGGVIWNKLLIGASFDTPGYLILKVGHVF